LDKGCSEDRAKIQSSKLLHEADLIVVGFLWKNDMSVDVIRDFLGVVKEASNKVLVLGSAGFLDMASVTYGLANSDKALAQDDVDKAVYKSRRLKFDAGNAIAADMAQQMSFKYFDRKDWYCDYAAKTCAVVSLEHGSLLWDNVHLTDYGRKVTAGKVSQSGLLNAF
jgi:SGNH domain (fused to AT3 domains)